MEGLLANGAGDCWKLARREIDERQVAEAHNGVAQALVVVALCCLRALAVVHHETMEIQHPMILKREIAILALSGVVRMTALHVRLEQGVGGEVLQAAHLALELARLMMIQRLLLDLHHARVIVEHDLVLLEMLIDGVLVAGLAL